MEGSTDCLQKTGGVVDVKAERVHKATYHGLTLRNQTSTTERVKCSTFKRYPEKSVHATDRSNVAAFHCQLDWQPSEDRRVRCPVG